MTASVWGSPNYNRYRYLFPTAPNWDLTKKSLAQSSMRFKYSIAAVTKSSEPTKLDRFWLEFSAPIPWLGGAESDEGLEVFGRPEGVYFEARQRWNAGADVCRKVGISQATYFNWKKRYDGLLPTEMRRLKQLEDENAKLKRIVADLSLDKEMLQDAIRRKL